MRRAAPDVAVIVAFAVASRCESAWQAAQAVVSGLAYVSVVVRYESSLGSVQGTVNWRTLSTECDWYVRARRSVVANSAQRHVPRTGAGCAGRADWRTEYRRGLERRCHLSTVSAREQSEVEIIIDG